MGLGDRGRDLIYIWSGVYKWEGKDGGSNAAGLKCLGISGSCPSFDDDDDDLIRFLIG